MNHAVTEAVFAKALLDRAGPIPDAVTSRNVREPTKRFSVYRNNVFVSLIEALGARFPAARSIVGDEFFDAMAREFVTGHPPRSPLLMQYGSDMPDFVEAFAPAADIPYLADVMRLEALRSDAYHAFDAEPAEAAALSAFDPTKLGALQVTLHPALRLLRSRFPVVTIFAMNSGLQPLRAIERWTGEDALVTRPSFEVFVAALPPGAFAFLSSLKAGATMIEAAEAAFSETPDFNISVAIAGLIHQKLAVAFFNPE